MLWKVGQTLPSYAKKDITQPFKVVFQVHRGPLEYCTLGAPLVDVILTPAKPLNSPAVRSTVALLLWDTWTKDGVFWSITLPKTSDARW